MKKIIKRLSFRTILFLFGTILVLIVAIPSLYSEVQRPCPIVDDDVVSVSRAPEVGVGVRSGITEGEGPVVVGDGPTNNIIKRLPRTRLSRECGGPRGRIVGAAILDDEGAEAYC